MTQYLISFGARAMDHIPGEDMPAVGQGPAHAVVQEGVNAGVFVCGGGTGRPAGRASWPADGTVTDGPYPEAVGGFTVVDVPSREEALDWGGQDRRRLPAARSKVRANRARPPSSTRCSARAGRRS